MSRNKIIFATLLVLFGILSRIFLNEKIGIPNFELVTTLSVLAGSLLGGVFGGAVSFLTIFFSDLYFGNTPIFLFTWSSFVIIGIVSSSVKRRSKDYISKVTTLGVSGVLFFYLWTNFGWWLISHMYPMNFSGLIECYTAALPFLRNQLLSVIIFTPTLGSVFLPLFKRFSSENIKLIQPNTNSR
ncbi:MAG: DUF6580 family putative transport protein [Patescibacteria group bacterium]